MSLSALVASGLLAGCGGQSVTTTDDVRAGEPQACAGSIDARGSVLRSEVGAGRLFTSGDRLIVVESRGRILSIDRCSGHAVELARDLGTVTASVLMEPHVWFRAGGSLSRLALAGGVVETVIADAPVSNLVTDGTRVYLFDGYSAPTAEVLSVGGVPVQASPLARVSVPTGYQVRLLAAGPAGLYYTYDCDCAPSLNRFVPGEMAPSTLEGAGGVGVWGSYVVHVGSDQLYVAANSRSGGEALRRLPFEGGEAEELLGPGARRATLVVKDRHVCWLGGPYEGPISLNCLSLLDPRRSAREIDSVESALITSLTLAEDAVYWLRPRIGEEAAYEIFSAAL